MLQSRISAYLSEKNFTLLIDSIRGGGVQSANSRASPACVQGTGSLSSGAIRDKGMDGSMNRNSFASVFAKGAGLIALTLAIWAGSGSQASAQLVPLGITVHTPVATIWNDDYEDNVSYFCYGDPILVEVQPLDEDPWWNCEVGPSVLVNDFLVLEMTQGEDPESLWTKSFGTYPPGYYTLTASAEDCYEDADPLIFSSFSLNGLAVVEEPAGSEHSETIGLHYGALKSPTSGAFVRLKADILPDDQYAAQLLEWSGVDVESDPRYADVDATTVACNHVTVSACGTTLEMNVWIIWATVIINFEDYFATWDDLVFPAYAGGSQITGPYQTSPTTTYPNHVHYNVEIIATIQPAGAGDIFTDDWDIEQIEEHNQWLGTTGTNYTHVSWHDDSPEPEFVQTPPINDQIFAIDGPGGAVIAAGGYFKVAFNFLTCAIWGGGFASDMKPWTVTTKTHTSSGAHIVDVNDAGSGLITLPTSY